MQITIETIPHANHRPEAGATVGDWQFDNSGNLTVRVSELGDPDYEFLIGLHEMVEAILCYKRGISQEVVDAFDRDHSDCPSEQGDMPDCPIRREHSFAEGIERLVAEALGVDWPAYGEAVAALP